MDDRRAKGFNTLFLEILDDSRMPSRDAHGHVAFQPETDITRPLEAYWQYADTVLDEAARRGFFVIMSDLWYGYGKGLWMHRVTPANAAAYGHFLGKRYAYRQNLMWMHCGDRNPDERLAECTRQLAQALSEERPRQLHTAHLSPGFASAAFFALEPWLDVNMAYTYGPSYRQWPPSMGGRIPSGRSSWVRRAMRASPTRSSCYPTPRRVTCGRPIGSGATHIGPYSPRVRLLRGDEALAL